jgi:hypothetical protein
LRFLYQEIKENENDTTEYEISNDDLDKLQEFQLETHLYMTKIRSKIVKRERKKMNLIRMNKDKKELDPGEVAEDRSEWDPGEIAEE